MLLRSYWSAWTIKTNKLSFNFICNSESIQNVELIQWYPPKSELLGHTRHGFWLTSKLVDPTTTFRSNFYARDDVFLVSMLRTGSTWLMALSHSILKKCENGDPLTTDNPHNLVPSVESNTNTKFDIYDASVPRLLHTHLPYSILPGSVKNSTCKIVYIARNPPSYPCGTSSMP